MIIKPRIKGFVCITSHPLGCLANLKDQVAVASKFQNRMRRKAKAGAGHRGFHGLRTGFESNGGFFSGSRYHGSLFRKTSEGKKKQQVRAITIRPLFVSLPEKRVSRPLASMETLSQPNARRRSFKKPRRRADPLIL